MNDGPSVQRCQCWIRSGNLRDGLAVLACAAVESLSDVVCREEALDYRGRGDEYDLDPVASDNLNHEKEITPILRERDVER
jgi:hypothetical protein